MNDYKDYSQAAKICAKFEGLRLQAYQDIVGIWTIGYGTTFYPDGTKVKQGDTCTVEQATEWLEIILDRFSKDIRKYITVELRKNQWEALLVLIYNIGPTNFSKSTLRKTINTNPDSLDIAENWTRFIKAGGKNNRGLLRRRLYEAYHYFSW